MLRNTIVFCEMLFSASLLGGTFPQDFQSATTLYYSGKSAEAEDAFVKLYEQKPSQRGMDKSMAYAAYCAVQQKQHEKAAAYAAKIQDKHANKSCRMNILLNQGKWDDLLLLSRDEDLEKWPDELIYDACLIRGRAYARKQNAENAEKDLLSAIKNTLSADNKAIAYQFLGNLYHEVSKDDQKALDAYGEAVKLGESIPIRRLGAAMTARARLLTAQGKGTQAIAELDRLKVDEIKDPSWRCAIQLCYGEVHESMGRRAEALARYRAAAACEKAPEALLVTAREKIEALEKNVAGGR